MSKIMHIQQNNKKSSTQRGYGSLMFARNSGNEYGKQIMDTATLQVKKAVPKLLVQAKHLEPMQQFGISNSNKQRSNVNIRSYRK